MTLNGMTGLSYRQQVQDPENEATGKSKRRLCASRLFEVYERILRQFDDRASFFQFLLGLCGSIFTNTGEHLGTSGFRHGFGFAEAEARQLANDLDNIDLLGAGLFNN